MRPRLGTLLIAFSIPAAAQQVPVVDLEPVQQFEEPFSRVRGVRELSDGSLLVVDQTEVSVYHIDFQTGARRVIGGEGAGPQEYRTIVGIAAMPGDSSLLSDLGNGRLVVIAPDGVLAESFPLAGDGYFRATTDADTVGHLYWWHDRSMIVRWNRRTGRIDTVTTLAPPDTYAAGGRDRNVAFSVSDWWAVSWDGHVAVARHAPYRVDWYRPDGTEVRGPVVDYEPYDVGRRERQAWDERPRASVSTGGGRGSAARPDERFPDQLPPFEWRGVFATPDGEAWVHRQQPAGSTQPLFDVFDATGTLIRQVRLPAGRTLHGFGPGTLYATREDDDGLLWLEQYRR